MNILPNAVKRRRAFIIELSVLKDIDEYELEYLREMADMGERPFWQAFHSVCGKQSGERILEIAKICADMVEHGYKEIMEVSDEPRMDWGDVALVMIQWHMIGVCAQEMAQYENQELCSAVRSCVAQTEGYLAKVIESRMGGMIRLEENGEKREKPLV